MKVLYSPVFSDVKRTFKLGNDKIQVIESGKTYVYDFSNLEDGHLSSPTNHIISAKRENGELSVELINYITEDASHSKRFPSWIKLTSFESFSNGELVNFEWITKSELNEIPIEEDRIQELEKELATLKQEKIAESQKIESNEREIALVWYEIAMGGI